MHYTYWIVVVFVRVCVCVFVGVCVRVCAWVCFLTSILFIF